jgi:mannose-6-phosphate isomerase-like protein (cupin superfamily)
MNVKAAISAAVSSREGKPFKATFFQSARLLLGINALEPGQVQEVHSHQDQDKFYLVHSGIGVFSVGNEVVEGRAGEVVWTPAGVPHGVRNDGAERLVLLVGIAPAPKVG